MKKFLYSFIIFIFLTSCAESSNNQFDFVGWTTESHEIQNIQDFLNIPDSDLTFSEGAYLSLGYSDSSFWVRIKLKEKQRNYENLMLSLSNPMLNEIEVYNQAGELVEKMGRVNVSNKDFNSIFNFSDLSGDNSVIYNIRIKSFGNVNVPISLLSDTHNYLTLNERNLIFGAYFGIVLAMFFYNLFLWVSTRDNLYGLYITYIFFVGVTQGVLGGYIDAFLWPTNTFLKEYGFYLSTALVNIVGIYYSLRFLKIKTFNPKLYTAGISIIVVYILILFAFIFDFGIGQLKFRFLQVFLGVVPFYLLFISSYSLRKGYRPAKFFLISWSLLICSMIIFLLSDLNILPNSFFTSYVFTFGSVFEVLLLSFALADKINILKKEKEKEQAERLIALAENEQLVRQQNFMLEEKVKIRTDELEQALRNLQNTQSQLVNQEKMASLGQLTAGIAHEINNPINFVSSNIMPLKRDIKDIMEVIEFYRTTGAREFTLASKKEAKQLEEDLELDYVLDEVDQLLRGMDDGARRTVEIVKGLRLFSRVDEQDMKKVDVHDGINSTVILLNSTMPPKIRIVRDFGELPLVECLAGKINQVFMNIINNAVHALADHIDTIVDPRIELKTRSLGEFVTIEIIDNGPGMPEQVKQRIFEPFFTTKAVGKGTGLGLSIVYSIIENHKGTLEVITEENQGTTFKITLPIYQSTQRYE
ncbi:7TM diverse intracellular signaling domain-containing protein [Algoriphagus sp. C2-6-M1]|uniref:sensor histidine kinase n=1 Tax=Algoriphagus persicinus TaxID=3108754 RepID=UPI002B3B1651|nr:7TM diverse intracellular signaling domain-containing protein [Algoriphagus sp. C2-6-M1]MEB2781953.1 7TM diverse intracellular signaling domain-containing protein [Algoriphagus sp. C2-6-M1]